MLDDVRCQVNVFRPGHTFPTMSLRELADREAAEARERQQADAEAKALRQLGAEDSDEDEEELHRQRAFDDFKDANPRGWGNSKLTPCG